MTHEEQSPTSDEELLKKQEELQELFDKVLDEETKKIIAELEKLLEKNNKNLTREQLQNLQLDNKSLEKELNRLLELYKQLEFDQLLQESIDELLEQADKQDELDRKSVVEGKRVSERVEPGGRR